MSFSLSDYRRLTKLREHRQINFLRAAVIGLTVGVLGLFFREAVAWGESFRSWVLATVSVYWFLGIILFPLFCAILGGLAGLITVKLAPEATGSGVPHLKAVLLHLRELNWRRVIPVKFFGGLLAITGGFSLGREGPTVQIGGAVGSLVADVLRVPRRSQAHLIACGAGAGLAAAFNAPLAGFIFVIEELRRELSPLTYGTALIASFSADVITRFASSASPSFVLPPLIPPQLQAFPLIVVLGAASGICAVAFNASLIRALEQVPKLRSRLPRWGRAAIIGFAVGVVGFFLPETLGPGYATVSAYLTPGGVFVVSHLVVLLLAKFLLTIICYCAGVPGGIFSPLLSQGALLGIIVYTCSKSFFPGIEVQGAAMGVIAMAAYFSASTRAPLTGVVLLVEMSGNYNMLFPLMVASLSAYLVAERLDSKPIYESLLSLNLRFRGPKESSTSEPVLIDVVVEPRSAMDGSRVKSLDLPEGCLMVTIKKGGEEFVPKASTVLHAGDQVTVVIDGKRASAASLVRAFATAP